MKSHSTLYTQYAFNAFSGTDYNYIFSIIYWRGGLQRDFERDLWIERHSFEILILPTQQSVYFRAICSKFENR